MGEGSEGFVDTTRVKPPVATNGKPCKKMAPLISFKNPDPLFSASYHDSLARTDRYFKIGAAVTPSIWALLVYSVFRYAPPESFECLTGVERFASVLAFAVLLVSNMSRIIPLVVRNKEGAFSGIILGSISIQTIALLTDAQMAFFPTPVMVDPVTGARVYLLRWCEWVPLATFMTFLTEGVDLPHPKYGSKLGLLHAAAQGVSCLAGLVFPFCANRVIWGTVMAVSCILFFTIFIRLSTKWKALKNTAKGNTVDEQEIYERVRLSFRLLATCAFMWSILVILYFVGWFAPLLSPPDSFWHSPALPMITETFCEVWSKILYLLIIVDVHSLIFDERSKATRRLTELRQMMAAVWESSSDVITISVQSARDGKVTTMVSPAYPKLDKALAATQSQNDRNDKQHDIVGGDDLRALVFELGAEDFAAAIKDNSAHPSIIPKRVYFDPLIGDTARASIDAQIHEVSPHSIPAIAAISELVVLAWRGDGESFEQEKETVLVHNFNNFVDDNKPEKVGCNTVRCETKVNRLEEYALLMVVRNISERFQRFEAEKRVMVERTAREKDAEANRFTRHEVKNGLLAAIGLCDSLQEALGDRGDDIVAKDNEVNSASVLRDNEAAAAMPLLSSVASTTWQGKVQGSLGSNVQIDVMRCITELDSTLQEVLDTILANSMARDVVHEVYQPKVERVDIWKALQGVRKLNDRFPLVTYPNPLPQFMFDPQVSFKSSYKIKPLTFHFADIFFHCPLCVTLSYCYTIPFHCLPKIYC